MTNILLSRGIIHHPHIFSHLKDYLKETDKVVILAFSFFPLWVPSKEAYDEIYEKGGEYYQKMVDSFIPYGILESNIEWIHYFKDNKESAIKKIKQADIIYFPGGAPDLMMKRIHEFGIKEALEEHDKVFIGSSAGAMIQFKNYHISKDNDYPHFTYEEGLHLLEGFSIEVHYRRKKTQKRALRKVNRAFRQSIYTIPDDSAIIVDHNEIKLIYNAKKTYHQKGVDRRNT
jgi:peptidase E